MSLSRPSSLSDSRCTLGRSLSRHPSLPYRLPFLSRSRMGSISREFYTPSPVYHGQPAATAHVPTLFLIRHGQAEHNVNPSHASRRDTVLTETGRVQAAQLRIALSEPLRRQIGAVVASPLRRALLTALLGFEDLIIDDRAESAGNALRNNPAETGQRRRWTQQSRLIALPEAQEVSDLPCDTGLPVAELVAELDSPDSKWRGRVNFDLMSAEDWGSKTGRWACDEQTLKMRARETRRWLRQKMRHLSLDENHAATRGGEKPQVRGDCVLVTHGGFLHYLTEDWDGFVPEAGQSFISAHYCPTPSLT